MHAFVALGTAVLEGGYSLDQGAAVRLTNAESISITARPHGAELLIWATD